MSELKFLLQFLSLSVALFAMLVNFSRAYNKRYVSGEGWFVQALATAIFVALTWF